MAPQTPLVVATSLNPYHRLELQVRCFLAWKALGAEILTLNARQEAVLLREAGLVDADILLMENGETGLAEHGRPLPRIDAMLSHVGNIAQDGQPVALVNSDLYPAMRSTRGLTFWLTHFPGVALGREDSAAPEIYHFANRNPYRSGLDAFVLPSDVLGRVCNDMAAYTASGRLCFGIPGWDYVLGMLICSEHIGGTIADSGLLLHQAHEPAYRDTDEFSRYLPEMAHFAGSHYDDPAKAAKAVRSTIEHACRKNAEKTRQAKTMYFTPVVSATPPGDAAVAIMRRLVRLCPMLEQTGQDRAGARLASYAPAGDPSCFARAMVVFVINPDPHYRFMQVLLATLFCLECGATGGAQGEISDHYPATNPHRAVLEVLRTSSAPDSPERRLDMAEFFGAELVQYGLFNPRLYNYLVLCCDTDPERAVLREILFLVRKFKNAA